ncbi:unnamed protein product [Tuber aestivum]|uniref:Extracellular membrane protein CFEM domain-containing protein n=1 Tax=Tuber aestivum TaxID=59557 RepID=A0A292PJJ5_9PEZI|nr:unnamed protein product [Tuber aestivum]
MVSSPSFLAPLGASSPSLGIALASVVLLLNLGATMVNAQSEEVQLGEPPECLLDCDYAKMWDNSDGEGIPEVQCVKDVLGSEWRNITENGMEELPEDTVKKLQSCACTDKPFVKEVATCLFEGCADNNTAVTDYSSEGIYLGYRACHYMFNVTLPAPTDVVKILGISVPSGVVVPTTVSGVPLATSWPGETTSSTVPSASSSQSGTTSGSAGGGAPNVGLRNAPSGLLTILCTLFAVGFVTVGARTDHDNDGDFDPYIPSCVSGCSDRLIRGSSTCTSATPAEEASMTSSSQAPVPPSLLLPLPLSLVPPIPLVSHVPMHPSETQPGRTTLLLEYLPRACLLLPQFCRRDKL